MVVSPDNKTLVKQFLADDNVYDVLGRNVVAIAGSLTSETLLEPDFCATETFKAMFPSQ